MKAEARIFLRDLKQITRQIIIRFMEERELVSRQFIDIRERASTVTACECFIAPLLITVIFCEHISQTTQLRLHVYRPLLVTCRYR